MKSKKKIFMLILCLVLVIASVIYLVSINKHPESVEVTKDAEKFKQEYESLNGTIREKDGKEIRSISIPTTNPIVYATAEEIVKMIDNNDTFAVYFGFADCPWCRSMIETMIEVAKELNINTIYYVDVKDIRDVYEVEDGELVHSKIGTDGYNDLLNKMNDVFSDYIIEVDEKKYDTKEKRIYAPNIVAVIKGKAMELETGISEDLEEGGNPYADLTDNMKKQSYNKIKCVLKCISDVSNTCSYKAAC